MDGARNLRTTKSCPGRSGGLLTTRALNIVVVRLLRTHFLGRFTRSMSWASASMHELPRGLVVDPPADDSKRGHLLVRCATSGL